MPRPLLASAALLLATLGLALACGACTRKVAHQAQQADLPIQAPAAAQGSTAQDGKPRNGKAHDARRFRDAPLITTLYTADPSAHVFGERLYVYPSHDIDAGVPADDLGSHFAMRDYHVLALDSIAGPARDLGVALDIAAVP